MASPEPAGAAVSASQDAGGVVGSIDGRVAPRVLWTFAGVAAGALIAGVFYLMKRRVGGFPRNPSWIAPITIMPSKDFADEGTFPDSPLDPHAEPSAHH
jgi:hypothetical protein